MRGIYGNRAIYKGNKEIVVDKVYFTKTGSRTDRDIVKLYCETMEPGTYQQNGRYFKDIPIEELDEYYRIHFRACYKGHSVRMSRISYESKEVQVSTGDDWGAPRKEEFEGFGFEATYIERGAMYVGIVPLDSLEKITRKWYSYKTAEREEKIVTKEEFWLEVLEAKSYLEKI